MIYGLVRDKDGNPKFDDWFNVPKQLWDTLSEKDKQYILKMRGQ